MQPKVKVLDFINNHLKTPSATSGLVTSSSSTTNKGATTLTIVTAAKTHVVSDEVVVLSHTSIGGVNTWVVEQ